MNETHSYDPETFHPSITHTVYVTLEGSQLRLAYPRANVSRWAALDETQHEAVFLHSRTYQLANCKVSVSVKQCSFWVPGGRSCPSDEDKIERQDDLSSELFTLISLSAPTVIEHGGERPDGLRLE